MMRAAAILALLISGQVYAHALVPMRLEVDSGAPTVIAVFTLTNRFKFQNRFAIDCYQGVEGHYRIECQSIPESIVLSPNASRKVKVRMDTKGDGLYRICSIEDPAENEDRQFITRLCALVGVGVDPNVRPGKRTKHRATTNAMATRPGPN